MRRWNGWGDDAVHYPLPDQAARYLVDLVGEGCPVPDASLAEVLSSVPASRLPAHPLVSTSPIDRLRHARGQSLPDWIALRSNGIGAFPDGMTFPAGVAYPTGDEDVRRLLDYSHRTGVRLIPYGGGTSVVGHINPLAGEVPSLTVDLSRLEYPTQIDEANYLVSLAAGLRGPEIEGQLNPRGYTLGHFPQSFELSTPGGWVATRSSGQQSYYYGRIEDLFAGGHVETPIGPLDLPGFPASAAGPDLRHLILGSEGRLGILTRVVLRLRRLPETEHFFGVFFRDWESGVAAVRQIAQARIPVSMVRLSDPQETETTLALSGKDDLVSWADRGLRLLGYRQERCLLIFGVTGSRRASGQARQSAVALFRDQHGLFTGTAIGKIWRKSRFLTPYLRNTLWEKGYALDTLETVLPWSSLLVTAETLKTLVREGLQEFGERVLVFAHLSHLYREGASLYVTFLFRRSPDPEETLRRWQRLKTSASRLIVSQGATISHQHGVGQDHAPYLPAEKGQAGMVLLEAARQALDPDGLLNPGKLLLER